MGARTTGLAGGGIKEVSHLSFLLLASLSRLAHNVSPGFLAYVFLNACIPVVGWEREMPSAPVVGSTAVAVEAEDAPRPSISACCFSSSTLTALWSFLAWRQSCEEPTINSNHLVGQFHFAFGKAAKNSLKRSFWNGLHMKGSRTPVPLRRWEKMGEGYSPAVLSFRDSYRGWKTSAMEERVGENYFQP